MATNTVIPFPTVKCPICSHVLNEHDGTADGICNECGQLTCISHSWCKCYDDALQAAAKVRWAKRILRLQPGNRLRWFWVIRYAVADRLPESTLERAGF